MASPTPKLQGALTDAKLVWGTADSATGTLASARIKRISRKSRAEQPIIEDNNGFTDTIVTLDDGDDLSITCVDDKTIIWPRPGTKATIKVRDWATSRDVLIGQNNSDQTNKAPGEVSLEAKYFVNVTLT